MPTIYIGLGSNIHPRESYLQGALEHLESHPAITVTARSSIYETAPVGYTDQADFLNMVVEIETLLKPLHLHAVCEGIEAEFGRERTVEWGPRTLDLDILLYSNENIKSNRLIIPHPRMHERAFVLIPLLEINPDAWTSPEGKTLAEQVEKLPPEDKRGVTKWKPES